MKSIYLAIAAAIAAIGTGVIIYKKRDYIRNSFATGSQRAKGMARSTWGRVADAAGKLGHTERDSQPS